ncbi:MAG: hypothetical protein BEU04_00680 [Marine Group III euryarchaeote CG-Bathy1]|uniref:Tryptophan 2,3-dioxygenase n=2 Tax=Methanobacteriati TaxID=3366610 RepID=A0A1J5TH99_9ARCH|nr:MAG: hypothetical protein BEU04_00680 [Marine Group III euryarchaeote CG-Bathy1]
MPTPTDKGSYPEYLRLKELLSLQSGWKEKEENISSDELHFIIVHQSFELWFKLVISELRQARDTLDESYVEETKIPKAVHHMERGIETFRLMAQQWKVMETLTPQGFLSFRDELGTASGFESKQMRTMEAIMGDFWIDGKKIENKINEKSIQEVVTKWLARTPIQGSLPNDSNDGQAVSEFVNEYLDIHLKLGEKAAHALSNNDDDETSNRFKDVNKQASEFLKPNGECDRARAGLLFIESYRELPLLSWPRKLIDTMVELEESMLLWRSSHARMVERMIGRRIGTGGSSGVDYLDRTSRYRVFTDLWGVRTILIKKEELPELKNSEFYSFVGETNE